MKKVFLIFMLAVSGAVILAEDPKLMKFADSLYDSGDYYRAISEYKRYIFYNESGALVKNAAYKISMSYLLAGKYDEAADTFDKISLKYSGELKFMSLLAESASLTLKKDYVYSNSVASRILNDPDAAKYTDKAHYVTGFNKLYQSEFDKASIEFGKISGTELKDSAASLVTFLNKNRDIPSRSPILSGLFSVIIPGAGHMYCGRWADGIISLLVNSFFVYNLYHAFVKNDAVQKVSYGLPETVIYFSSIYGSVVSALKFNEDETAKFVKSAEEYKADIIKTEF